MKNQLFVPRLRRNPKRTLVFTAAVLFLVTGMFLASVMVPPLATPVQALKAPLSDTSVAPSSDGIAGTLASFTALIPEIITVSLPLLFR
jgi:hypothetical protein